MAESHDTAALMTDPHRGVIMPSAHHSVVAKAQGVCADVLAVEQRSHDVHVPSPASTDGLGTVFPEQR
jgi:hypothetical protein